jgi:hypothetical protein
MITLDEQIKAMQGIVMDGEKEMLDITDPVEKEVENEVIDLSKAVLTSLETLRVLRSMAITID